MKPLEDATIAAERLAARAELCAVLAGLDDADAISSLLDDLMTEAEVEAIADRWRVVPLVMEGLSYRAINARTGLSLTTIGRVAKCVDRGSGGYRRAMEHLRQA